MGAYVGKLEKGFLAEEEIFAVGFFNVEIAIAKRTALFVGGGRLKALAGENCYLIARGKPILAGSVHCYNLVAVGSASPVVANSVRCRNLYARRFIVSELDAGKAVLGEMCIVENLTRAEKVVFTDPHVYFKKLGFVGESWFTYDICD